MSTKNLVVHVFFPTFRFIFELIDDLASSSPAGIDSLNKGGQTLRATRAALKPMIAAIGVAFYLASQGYSELAPCRRNFAEPAMMKTKFRWTLAHQGTLSRRISLDLVSRRPGFC